MAKITAISRCTGGGHVHLTIQRTNGTSFERVYDMSDLIAATDYNEQYIQERVKLMVREAQAAGNTTYAQIRTYLLNREFVE